jgi:hypothetical protein
MDKCPNCGGSMVGDGYTMYRHCENLEHTYQDREPDSPPIFCQSPMSSKSSPSSDRCDTHWCKNCTVEGYCAVNDADCEDRTRYDDGE